MGLYSLSIPVDLLLISESVTMKLFKGETVYVAIQDAAEEGLHKEIRLDALQGGPKWRPEDVRTNTERSGDRDGPQTGQGGFNGEEGRKLHQGGVHVRANSAHLDVAGAESNDADEPPEGRAAGRPSQERCDSAACSAGEEVTEKLEGENVEDEPGYGFGV